MKTAQPLHLTHPFLALCERSIVVTEAERFALGELPFVEDTLTSGDVPGWTGDRPSRSFLILEGLLGTSKTMRDGAVQVTAFHIPGDMLGLPSLHLEALDSDIAALAPSKVAFVENSDLRRLCEEHPRIAALLWRTTLVDAAVACEWVVNAAQRQALSRVAHLFCEMMLRMDAVGLVEEGGCVLHLTQADLS
jgi:CRP-like cAMP-binding protein